MLCAFAQIALSEHLQLARELTLPKRKVHTQGPTDISKVAKRLGNALEVVSHLGSQVLEILLDWVIFELPWHVYEQWFIKGITTNLHGFSDKMPSTGER